MTGHVKLPMHEVITLTLRACYLQSTIVLGCMNTPFWGLYPYLIWVRVGYGYKRTLYIFEGKKVIFIIILVMVCRVREETGPTTTDLESKPMPKLQPMTLCSLRLVKSSHLTSSSSFASLFSASFPLSLFTFDFLFEF